jgi:hypothetical protein
MTGIPRGKIRPWDGCLISIRMEFDQVSCPSSAFVVCKRSRDLQLPVLSGVGPARGLAEAYGL